MSLWTPGGEHEVPREPTQPASSAGAAQPAGAPAMPGMPDMEDLSPEERAQVEAMAQEMAQVREQLASTPASTVVANHAMGLYELGAIHLSKEPPDLAEARVAIDAMGAVVEALSGRLAEAEQTLTDALNQIRMVYVQLGQDAAGTTEPATEESTETD